jgi:hypothetical protein
MMGKLSRCPTIEWMIDGDTYITYGKTMIAWLEEQRSVLRGRPADPEPTAEDPPSVEDERDDRAVMLVACES